VEKIIKKERVVENPVEIERIVEQEKIIYKVKFCARTPLLDVILTLSFVHQTAGSHCLSGPHRVSRQSR
jgi:hypothetical protein